MCPGLCYWSQRVGSEKLIKAGFCHTLPISYLSLNIRHTRISFLYLQQPVRTKFNILVKISCKYFSKDQNILVEISGRFQSLVCPNHLTYMPQAENSCSTVIPVFPPLTDDKDSASDQVKYMPLQDTCVDLVEWNRFWLMFWFPQVKKKKKKKFLWMEEKSSPYWSLYSLGIWRVTWRI